MRRCKMRQSGDEMRRWFLVYLRDFVALMAY